MLVRTVRCVCTFCVGEQMYCDLSVEESRFDFSRMQRFGGALGFLALNSCDFSLCHRAEAIVWS